MKFFTENQRMDTKFSGVGFLITWSVRIRVIFKSIFMINYSNMKPKIADSIIMVLHFTK